VPSQRLPRWTDLAVLCVLAPAAAAQVRFARTKVGVSDHHVVVQEGSCDGLLTRNGPLLSPPGVLWSYDDNGQGWIGNTVSIGDHGQQVFSELHKNAQAAVLLSAFDHDPASAVWSNPATGTDARKVASAEDTDLHVAAHELVVGTLRRVEVETYRSSSAQPLWSYTFAPLIAGGSSVGISRSGERIVAGIHNAAAARVELAVFDGDAGALLSYTTLPVRGALHAFDLSADGSTLLVTADTTLYVFDVASAAVSFSVDVSTSLDAVAISGNGDVIACGGFNWMRVWERNTSGGWSPTFTRFVPGSNYVGALDVSADGSTVAYAFTYYDTFLTVRIEAFDVAAKVVTMTDIATGVGLLQNVVGDIAVCADGSRFAVGVWGDAINSVPELRYYARNQNTALSLVDMPGSVYAVAISADGRRVAAAGKAVHANTLGNGGSIVLLDAGNADFTLEGAPRIGTAPVFKVHGPVGHGAWLIMSEGTASTPIPAFNGGLLYLDRDRLNFFPMGTVGLGGSADAPYTIAAAPGLVGATLYFQGLTLGPRALTEDWLPITILP
jgi:hypothetical protein